MVFECEWIHVHQWILHVLECLFKQGNVCWIPSPSNGQKALKCFTSISVVIPQWNNTLNKLKQDCLWKADILEIFEDAYQTTPTEYLSHDECKIWLCEVMAAITFSGVKSTVFFSKRNWKKSWESPKMEIFSKVPVQFYFNIHKCSSSNRLRTSQLFTV